MTTVTRPALALPVEAVGAHDLLTSRGLLRVDMAYRTIVGHGVIHAACRVGAFIVVTVARSEWSLATGTPSVNQHDIVLHDSEDVLLNVPGRREPEPVAPAAPAAASVV